MSAPTRESLLDAVSAALGASVEVEGRLQGQGMAEAATLLVGPPGKARRSRFFMKWSLSAPEDFFTAEAHGLAALQATGAVRTPEIVAVGAHFLVLERVGEGRRGPEFGPRLGRQLAALHRATAPQWGFSRDNYCGRTPQPNGWLGTWPAFFAERRLLPQIEMLARAGAAPAALIAAVQQVARRIDTWLGASGEPPSLVHGDLWGGNVLVGEDGCPVLIDPAAHYAHREVDLAMTELFGGFPRSFHAEYNGCWPLEAGHAERRELYNLYHLLNHANLFGGSYVQQALEVARRYC